jgi:hypothetical protein
MVVFARAVDATLGRLGALLKRNLSGECARK